MEELNTNAKSTKEALKAGAAGGADYNQTIGSQLFTAIPLPLTELPSVALKFQLPSK